MRGTGRRAALLAACAALAAYSLTLAALGRARPAAAETLPAREASAPLPVPAAETEGTEDFPPYELRAVEGEVCLCLEGETVLRTGVAAATLPRQDREALAAGIPVGSRAELAALLEDLGS